MHNLPNFPSIANQSPEEAELTEAVHVLDIQRIQRCLDHVPNLGRSVWNIRRSPLQCAAENGHVELIKILLQRGVDVNCTDYRGSTALHLASCYNQPKATLILLEHGADQTMTFWGKTALQLARELNYFDVAHILNQHHHFLHTQDLPGPTEEFLMNYALETGNIQEFKRLLPKLKNPGRKVWPMHTSLLHTAAKDGYTEVVRLLLGAGVDPSSVMGTCGTALAMATTFGNTKIIQILLEQGGNPDIQDRVGNTALHKGVTSNKPDAVKALLQGGADTSLKNKDNQTPLELALKVSQSQKVAEVVRLLTNHETPATKKRALEDIEIKLVHAVDKNDLSTIKSLLPNLKNPSRQHWEKSPLHLAAANGQVECVGILLDSGININSLDSDGSTALFGASMMKQAEVVKVLLKRGAKVNEKGTTNSWTPLHVAVTFGQFEIAEMLIGKGADVNARDKNGMTPLHAAVEQGIVPLVKTLAARNADPNLKAYDGLAPIDMVGRVGNPVVAAKLMDIMTMEGPMYKALAQIALPKINLETALEKACSTNDVGTIIRLLPALDCPDRRYWSAHSRPLHVAAMDGNDGVVRLLLNAGFNVNSEYPPGYTVLFNAVQGGHATTLKLLLSKKPRLNPQSRLTGITPLIQAAQYGKFVSAKLLLEAGANPNISDCNGETPLDNAEDNEHKKIAKIIRKYGGKHEKEINTLTEKELHLAVQNDDTAKVERLLPHIKNPSRTQWDTMVYPLHVAVASGNFEILRLLLDAGFNVNSTARNDMTPLHYAIMNEQHAMVGLLISAGANVNAQEEYDWNTPLHTACCKLDKESMQLLLDCGANVNIKNRYGRTFTEYHDKIEENMSGVSMTREELRKDLEVTATAPSPSEAAESIDKFTCCLCHKIPRTRVFTCKKGHMICESCDKILKQEKKGYRCPTCRQDFTVTAPISSSALKWLMEEGQMDKSRERTMQFLLKTKCL